MFNFIVVPDKIVYFNTPGCGTKTVLGWATCIQQPELYTSSPHLFAESRTERGIEYKEFHDLIPNKKKNELKGLGYKGFVIVKDPVQRFIDNYRARILHQKKTSVNISSISDFINRFDEIIETDTKGIKYWFRSQINDIDNKPEIYNKIFNINQMNEVKAYLELYSGVTLPDLHLNKVPDTIEVPTLTQSEIDWIKERFKNDYLYYSKWF